MKKGAYRCYFHIGNYGFKFPKYDKLNGNPFLGFLCGIIMNVLERKRYKYYVQRKKMCQWGHTWEYTYQTPILCPCYFSFLGLVNIVKHLPKEVLQKDLGEFIEDIEKRWWEKTAYLVINDIKPENFKKDEHGKIYCIDYGDFTTGGFNRTCVLDIDYK